MCEVFAFYPMFVSVLWPSALEGPKAVDCRYGDIQVNGAGLPSVPGLTGEHGRLFSQVFLASEADIFARNSPADTLVFQSSSDELIYQYGAMASRGIKEEMDKLRLSRHNLEQRCCLC